MATQDGTTDKWWLADTDERKRAAPYTFYQPPRELVSRLAVGDGVKLIFEFDSDDNEAPGAERMWVMITEVKDGRFAGQLENTPRFIKGLSQGALVTFESRHIANTTLDEDDGLEPFANRCLVSRKVLDEGQPVGYLYREEPDMEEDSGWRIFAGDESDEYLENSDNIEFVSLGAVLNRDDSFLHLLGAPAESFFARDEETGEFVQLEE
jgi:hypothetical protein